MRRTCIVAIFSLGSISFAQEEKSVPPSLDAVAEALIDPNCLASRAQKSLPLNNGTVEFHRSLADPESFLEEVVQYMDVGSNLSGSDDWSAALAALTSISRATLLGDFVGVKDSVDGFLVNNPGNALAYVVVYYGFNSMAAVVSDVPQPDQFEAMIPRWDYLPDLLSKWIVVWSYFDNAWQAGIEDDRDTAHTFYRAAMQRAWETIVAHPNDLAIILCVDFYGRAAMYTGEGSILEAVHNLRTLIEASDPSLVAWCARYQLGYISSVSDAVPKESVEQYRTMRDQLDSGAVNVGAVLQDTAVAKEARSWLALLRAHVYSGAGDTAYADTLYAEVLSQYSDRAEWVPWTRTKPHHDARQFGLCNMTLFAVAENSKRLHRGGDLSLVRDAYVEYVNRYPRGEYADYALLQLGRVHEEMGNPALAEDAYDRIIEEFENGSIRGAAERSLKSIGR